MTKEIPQEYLCEDAGDVHVVTMDYRYWRRVESGDLTFAILKNDRAFMVGDYLCIEAYSDATCMEKMALRRAFPVDKDGRETEAPARTHTRISYIIHGGETHTVGAGYCVIALKRCKDAHPATPDVVSVDKGGAF